MPTRLETRRFRRRPGEEDRLCALYPRATLGRKGRSILGINIVQRDAVSLEGLPQLPHEPAPHTHTRNLPNLMPVPPAQKAMWALIHSLMALAPLYSVMLRLTSDSPADAVKHDCRKGMTLTTTRYFLNCFVSLLSWPMHKHDGRALDRPRFGSVGEYTMGTGT